MALGKQLENVHDCSVSYLAINSSSDDLDQPEYTALAKRTSTELLSALRSAELPEGACILLQFSGYAYGNRGICFWLAKSLERFLTERPGVRLVTMFHELWTPAPILSRSSWVRPLQRSIVKRLVKISDAVLTNRVRYREQIQAAVPSVTAPIGVNNVFSNFGEPSDLRPIGDRRRQIVVMQPPDLATAAGESYWRSWQRLCDLVGQIPTIVVGRVRQLPESDLIEPRGFVSADEGSRLLAESQFAHFEYFDGYLGKSGIFAAFASHGIVPVMPRPNHSQAEGVVHQTHYLLADDDALLDTKSLEAISTNLQQWYRPHNIAATAGNYVNAIHKPSSSGSSA